jgi:hypothetical protein
MTALAAMTAKAVMLLWINTDQTPELVYYSSKLNDNSCHFVSFVINSFKTG